MSNLYFFYNRFSNRALMSSSHCLWHITGRVLAWVTLLFAVGTKITYRQVYANSVG
jgi:hypothetical protein